MCIFCRYIQKEEDGIVLEKTEWEVNRTVGDWIQVIVSYIQDEDLWVSINGQVSF